MFHDSSQNLVIQGRNNFVDVIFKIFLVFGVPQKNFWWKVCRQPKKVENHCSLEMQKVQRQTRGLDLFLQYMHSCDVISPLKVHWVLGHLWNNTQNMCRWIHRSNGQDGRQAGKMRPNNIPQASKNYVNLFVSFWSLFY